MKENREKLVTFKEIMRFTLKDAKTSAFIRLRGKRDFTDGFLLSKGALPSAFRLQRRLIEHNLSVKQPIVHKKEGYYWF